MGKQKKKENWSSRTGVILAVTGSAVGVANFLRFPGQAAQFDRIFSLSPNPSPPNRLG